MVARRNITEGSEFTYSGEASIGADAGALVPGSKVRVREQVAADEKGAHDGSEDCVVIVWDAPSLVQGENGVEVGFAERAMSIGLSQFQSEFTEA